MVAGVGFYSYNNLQCIKLDEERKNVRKKSFINTKKHLTLFKEWFQSRVGLNSTPAMWNMCLMKKENMVLTFGID